MAGMIKEMSKRHDVYESKLRDIHKRFETAIEMYVKTSSKLFGELQEAIEEYETEKRRAKNE